MKAWIRVLMAWLLAWGILGIGFAGWAQVRKYGIYDDYNDLRGENPLGVEQWGMGGVRTAMESNGGAVIYCPAGLAWDIPPSLSGEFEIRTPFPRSSDFPSAESQTLFLPRWVGMVFATGSWRLGMAYALPYGHRRVTRILATKYEHTLAEHRILIPVAWRVAERWALGVSVGLSIASWNEDQNGSDTDNTATGFGFASSVHVQWRPRSDLVLGFEAQPPMKVSGDADINAVNFSEEWERPEEFRVGVQKRWQRFRGAMDLFFRGYSGHDIWMVDRGYMSENQYGGAVGVEFDWLGAKVRFGSQVETDPVEGGDDLAIMVTTGVGWSLGGVDVRTSLVDSHSSTDKYLRATRFLVGFDILSNDETDQD
jgi:hypothetical protein